MEGLEIIDFTPPVPSCYNLVNCETGAVDYIINSTSNGVILSEYVNQYVGQITVGSDTFYGCWNIQISFGCEGFRTDVGVYDIVAADDLTNYCGCPTGFTYNPVTNRCEGVTTVQPTVATTPLQSYAGSSNGAYGAYGVAYFPNITTAAYPIYDVAGVPANFPADFGKVFTDTNVQLIPSVVLPNPTDWSYLRLNNVGVWVQNTIALCDEWIGFSYCVDIPTTKTYCIGIAGDNRVRLKLDGVQILSIEYSAYTYRTWNVFEITLTAGIHIIELEGWNNSILPNPDLPPGPTNQPICNSPSANPGGNPASFGAEIYDATAAQVQTWTTSIPVGKLLFSTKDYRSTTGNPFYFDIGTYTCGNGFALNTCDEPICQQIITVPFRECCYQLINCDTQEVDYQFSYAGEELPNGVPDPSSIIAPEVISSIIVDGNTLTGCWTIQKTQTGACTGPVTTYNWADVTNVATLSDCETCLPSCYILEDCKGIQTAIVVTYPNLNAYDGKVISFEIPTSPVYPDNWPAGKYCASVSTTKVCEDGINIQMNNIVAYDTCILCSPPCFLLTSCSDPTNTMVVSGDLSQYVGGVITLAGCNSICWIVTYADDCTDSVPSPPIATFLPPQETLPTKCCYTYGKPEDFDGTITINGIVYPILVGSVDVNDLVNAINIILSGITGGGICTVVYQGLGGANTQICIVGTATYGDLTYSGDSVGIASQVCSVVLKSCVYSTYDFNDINPSSTFIKITIDGTLYNINITPPLTSPLDIIYYLNELLLGEFSYIESGTNFTIYVYGNHTYSNITIGTVIASSLIILDDCTDYANTTANCEACLPDPPAPIPFTLHTRKVKPGYDTKGCPPEYTEKVLCNFAEQAFDEMAKARYGIKICCEHDFDYWDIKKQILELKALYDENVCHVQFPCICYSLSNADPINSTIFNYSDCSGKYLTIEVTNSDGIVKVCATNLPVGMGGTPTVVQGALCQDETCL